MNVKKTALEEARTRYPNITEDELVLMAKNAAPYTNYRANKRFGAIAFQIEKRTIKRVHFLSGQAYDAFGAVCPDCNGTGMLHIPTDSGNQPVPCRKC